MHLSERARTIQESAIRKLDAAVLRASGVHFHRLNIGQPDVPTPRSVMDALAKEDGPVLAYGPASGLPECRAAAAAFHAKVSPGIGPEHVVVTQGGSEALLFAMTALCDPGDEILVPEPYYTNYNGFATVAAAKVVPLRTRLDDGFAIPSDDVLDAALTPRTRMLLFSNPGNPTGAVYGGDELRRVAKWAKRNDIWLVADEVYRAIWFKEAPLSALQLAGHEDHVILIDSTSKTFSACGLRVGFLVSRNLALMERIERLGQARLGPQPRGQRAAIAALSLPESYYDEVRAAYRSRVDAMMDALAQLPGVAFHRPEGAFYTMARLPVDDTERFARFLVEEFRDRSTGQEESVVVAPGPGFYADPRDGRDEIRLAAVREEKVLRRAIEVLGRGLETYRGRVAG
ncbi:MAG: pyridoxal phosphate-dependent aminotransferase [Pseudomonadota bacterium]|nr:pyridoxal phosphate-dependent aminotransferase [Pseudomonadota bacterium]